MHTVVAHKLQRPRLFTIATKVTRCVCSSEKAIDDMVAQLLKEKTNEHHHKVFGVDEFNTQKGDLDSQPVA